MTNAEKALTFQHNKTALASADLNQRVCLLTLANRLNLVLTAESGLADWEKNLLRNWANSDHTIPKETPLSIQRMQQIPPFSSPSRMARRMIVTALGLSLSASNWNWTILTSQQPRQAFQHPTPSNTVNIIYNFHRTQRI
jgi:hypothetical protein